MMQKNKTPSITMIISLLGMVLTVFGAIGGAYAFSYDISSGIKEKVSKLTERMARVETTIEIFAESRDTMEEFNRNSDILRELLLDYKLNKQ